MKNNSFLLCLVLLVCNVAQAADLQLGPATLTRKRAPHLSSSGRLSAMLPLSGNVRPSKMYLKSVGGVGFDSVAIPEEGLAISDISVSYAESKPDGRRLALTINGKSTSADLYDWQLIPIAEFADSDNPSCFTLYGKLEDAAEQDALQEQGSRIMNYAAPFDNTLLGLRLMQLDLLLLGEVSFSTDLPKESGNYVLGGGESEPDLAGNRAAKLGYDTAFEQLASRIGDEKSKWSTYVICDVKQKVRFSIDDGTLRLTGEPYYYFASSNHAELVSAEVRDRVDAGETNLAEAMLRIQFGLPIEPSDRAAIQKIVDRAVPKSVYEFKADLSDAHSDLVPFIAKMNPQVWQAARVTMRYAAFFRYCKAKAPENWKQFIASIQNVRLSPKVETPTVLTISR